MLLRRVWTCRGISHVTGRQQKSGTDLSLVQLSHASALVPTLRGQGWECCLQVAEKLRQDERLTVVDRTNLRYLTQQALGNPAPLDLATLDLSFISVLKVMPAVCSLLSPRGQLIVLIKPQFEAGKSQVLTPLPSPTISIAMPSMLHVKFCSLFEVVEAATVIHLLSCFSTDIAVQLSISSQLFVCSRKAPLVSSSSSELTVKLACSVRTMSLDQTTS